MIFSDEILKEMLRITDDQKQPLEKAAGPELKMDPSQFSFIDTPTDELSAAAMPFIENVVLAVDYDGQDKELLKEKKKALELDDIVEQAHPETAFMADGPMGTGVVENQNEQHTKILNTIYKMPTGFHFNTFAELAQGLNALAERLEVKGDLEAVRKVDEALAAMAASKKKSLNKESAPPEKRVPPSMKRPSHHAIPGEMPPKTPKPSTSLVPYGQTGLVPTKPSTALVPSAPSAPGLLGPGPRAPGQLGPGRAPRQLGPGPKAPLTITMGPDGRAIMGPTGRVEKDITPKSRSRTRTPSNVKVEPGAKQFRPGDKPKETRGPKPSPKKVDFGPGAKPKPVDLGPGAKPKPVDLGPGAKPTPGKPGTRMVQPGDRLEPKKPLSERMKDKAKGIKEKLKPGETKVKSLTPEAPAGKAKPPKLPAGARAAGVFSRMGDWIKGLGKGGKAGLAAAAVIAAGAGIYSIWQALKDDWDSAIEAAETAANEADHSGAKAIVNSLKQQGNAIKAQGKELSEADVKSFEALKSMVDKLAALAPSVSEAMVEAAGRLSKIIAGLEEEVASHVNKNIEGGARTGPDPERVAGLQRWFKKQTGDQDLAETGEITPRLRRHVEAFVKNMRKKFGRKFVELTRDTFNTNFILTNYDHDHIDEAFQIWQNPRGAVTVEEEEKAAIKV